MTIEQDLFIDTNVFISILESLTTESYLAVMDKSRGIRLLSFSSQGQQCDEASRKVIYEIENNKANLEEVYVFLSGSKGIITSGVKKQIQRKNTEKLGILEDIVKRRAEEFLFIQISSKFGQEHQSLSKQNMLTFLSYKKIIESLNNITDSEPYLPSPHFDAIREYVGVINTTLKLQKEIHKYDAGTDEKIVASVLDNILFNNKKTAVASNDKDLYNMTIGSYFLLYSAHNLGNGRLKFLSENPPAVYQFTKENKFTKLPYNNFKGELAEKLGPDNPEIGKLADLTVRLLVDTKLY